MPRSPWSAIRAGGSIVIICPPGRAVSVGRLRQVVDELYFRKKSLHLVPPDEWNREHLRKYVRSPLQ
jgi:hypothetical protein